MTKTPIDIIGNHKFQSILLFDLNHFCFSITKQLYFGRMRISERFYWHRNMLCFIYLFLFMCLTFLKANINSHCSKSIGSLTKYIYEYAITRTIEFMLTKRLLHIRINVHLYPPLLHHFLHPFPFMWKRCKIWQMCTQLNLISIWPNCFCICHTPIHWMVRFWFILSFLLCAHKRKWTNNAINAMEMFLSRKIMPIQILIFWLRKKMKRKKNTSCNIATEARDNQIYIEAKNSSQKSWMNDLTFFSVGFSFLSSCKVFIQHMCACKEFVRRPLTNEPIGCMQHLFQSESDSCRSRSQTDEQQNRSRPCKTGKSSTIKVDHLSQLAVGCNLFCYSHFSLFTWMETRDSFAIRLRWISQKIARSKSISRHIHLCWLHLYYISTSRKCISAESWS